MPVIECDVSAARDTLEEAGVTVTSGNTDHEVWRATRGGATAVAYDGKVVVQGERPTDLTALLSSDDGGRVELYFDGASRGNPGPSAIGWVLSTSDGIVDEGGSTIGRATNNQAEYEALIAGLRVARDYGFDEIAIHGDSELIVRQMTGEWDTNDPTLREKRLDAREVLTSFDNWSITHVPRDLNDRADELANDALDNAG
jgi:ribonuclease HI